MTINEFNNLSVSKKAEFIWEWGYFISRSISANSNTVIFRIEDFYAEVCFVLSDNRISRINVLAVEEHYPGEAPETIHQSLEA